MTFPNLDNTFLASLSLYRKLRGGKWYLRHYKLTDQSKREVYYNRKTLTGFSVGEVLAGWMTWTRYGGKSPMSYVVKSEDYTPPSKPLPFMAGLGGTLIDGKW